MKRSPSKQFLVLLLMVLFLTACTTMGATNTTQTNKLVTTYEVAGVTLAQAYSTEKALFKAGTITAQQDSDFQLGVYTDAVNCYNQIGVAAEAILKAKDIATKTTWQAKFDALSADLPGLVAKVTAFLATFK